MQKISGNGSQSELKLLGRSEKTFYVTSITHILAIRTVKLHKNFTTCFHISLVQDPMVGIRKKYILNRFEVNALEFVVLSDFWRENAKEL